MYFNVIIIFLSEIRNYNKHSHLKNTTETNNIFKSQQESRWILIFLQNKLKLENDLTEHTNDKTVFQYPKLTYDKTVLQYPKHMPEDE